MVNYLTPSCVDTNSKMTINSYPYTKNKWKFAVQHFEGETGSPPDIVGYASRFLRNKKVKKEKGQGLLISNFLCRWHASVAMNFHPWVSLF